MDNKNIFNSLPDAGWVRVDRASDRVFATRDGSRYPTFERDGVRIALAGSRSLGLDRGIVTVFDACCPDEVIVWALLVDEEFRKQGKAKAALQELVSLADTFGTTLYIEPAPLEKTGPGRDVLVRTYKAAGFQPIEAGINKIMVRRPGDDVA